MRFSVLKALLFVAVAVLALIVTGPLVGVIVAITGTSSVPVWAYSGAFSVLLLSSTAAAVVLRTGFRSLGLEPTRQRIRECAFGFAVGALLFVVVALIRGVSVEAAWTFAGPRGLGTACAGLLIALLLLLPEEMLFRGYAFQRRSRLSAPGRRS